MPSSSPWSAPSLPSQRKRTHLARRDRCVSHCETLGPRTGISGHEIWGASRCVSEHQTGRRWEAYLAPPDGLRLAPRDEVRLAVRDGVRLGTRDAAISIKSPSQTGYVSGSEMEGVSRSETGSISWSETEFVSGSEIAGAKTSHLAQRDDRDHLAQRDGQKKGLVNPFSRNLWAGGV